MMTLTEAKAKADRLESRLRRIREEGLTVVRRGGHLMLAAGGGVASAACQAYMPKIPGTEVPTDLAIGIAGAVVGTFDLLGGAADEVIAFASGTLGAVTAREIAPLLKRAA